MNEDPLTAFIEHYDTATRCILEPEEISLAKQTTAKYCRCRSSEAWGSWHISWHMQELLFEQIDARGKLVTLLIDNVGQYCMFEVSENIESTVLDNPVLPLCDEAAEGFTQPLYSIYDMMEVMQFWLEAGAHSCEKLVELND